MNTTDDSLLKYMRLLSFLELALRLPYYPEDLLPADKPHIRQLLNQSATAHPQEADAIQRYISSLDRFIPFPQAMQLAKDYQQVERKNSGLEYDQESAKRYWKTVHALYGVDEQLDA